MARTRGDYLRSLSEVERTNIEIDETDGLISLLSNRKARLEAKLSR